MKYGQDTVAWVRSVMAPGNPVPGDVPSGSEEDLHRQRAYDRILALARNDTAAPPRPAGAGLPGRGQPRGGRALRVIAPVAAGLAVAGLVTGVTLAAGSRVPARGPAAGALAAADKGMPRFYVTLSWPDGDLAGGLPKPPGQIIAEVHASQTGQVLSRVGVGFPGNGMGISADQSDRAFVIDAAASNDEASNRIALYLLRVSAARSAATRLARRHRRHRRLSGRDQARRRPAGQPEPQRAEPARRDRCVLAERRRDSGLDRSAG
jgi:hypothetical protein